MATLADSFGRKTCARGRDYFYQDRVLITAQDDRCTWALVSGSSGDAYHVIVDDPTSDPELENSLCSCPHFERGYLCKHIWATLLEMEASGLIDEALDGTPSNGRGSRGASKKRRQTAIKDAIAKSSWKRQLTQLASNADKEPRDPWKQSYAKRNEVWYLLNVGASQAADQLTLNLFLRETKKSGEFGKLKRLAVDHNQLENFTLPDDRQTLAMLLGGQSVGSLYGYSYHHQSSSTSQLIVPAALLSQLLPMLAATGRFAWGLEAEAGVAAENVIDWDAGPPWRLAMRCDENHAENCWVLCGEFARGAASKSFDEPILTLSDGYVLWPDNKLARLDCAGNPQWLTTLRGHGEIQIPFAEKHDFLSHVWSEAPLAGLDWPASLKLKPIHTAPLGCIRFSQRDKVYHYDRTRWLLGQVSYQYKEWTVPVGSTQRGQVDSELGEVIVRDFEAEQTLWQQLLRLSLQQPNAYESTHADLKVPEARLPEVVSQLVNDGWQVEAEGKTIRSAGDFNIQVRSGVDWFELEAEVDFDGNRVTLPELLQAAKKGEPYIQLVDGSQGVLPSAWLEKYGGLAELGETDGDSLRFRQSQGLLLDALLASQPQAKFDRGFRQLRKKLSQFNGVKPKAPPRTFRGELRDYQQQGLGWLNFLRDFGFGGCLADDMGLGKTVQVLALLDARRTRRVAKGAIRRPSLVVVPKSLVFNWIEEAARFAPKLRMLDYTGLARKQRLETIDEHDVVVTTYGTLRRDIALLKETPFDYVILDESQAIKNARSQASKACRLVQADYRLAMTGTPIENHLGELESLFEFLNPGMLGSSATANSLLKSAGKGDADSLAVLRQGLAPYLLRRTKEEVLKELPEKTEQTIFCEMGPRQRKQYNELRDYYRQLLQERIKDVGIKRSKIHVLEALLRLRQAACDPGLLNEKRTNPSSAKIDLLLPQLEEVTAEGHKALVFSQFTSLLSIVRQRLDANGFTYEYLDGRTPKRQEKVRRFQEDSACPLFLISLKAGGHGLNLTAADYVYILDPWWNPAVEAQAVDRAHRIGQTKPVFAYRLICRDTVEENIMRLQDQKRELADAIIAGNNNIIRSLTAQDLQLLLS